jgi:hypothetical protein
MSILTSVAWPDVRTLLRDRPAGEPWVTTVEQWLLDGLRSLGPEPPEGLARWVTVRTVDFRGTFPDTVIETRFIARPRDRKPVEGGFTQPVWDPDDWDMDPEGNVEPRVEDIIYYGWPEMWVANLRTAAGIAADGNGRPSPRAEHDPTTGAVVAWTDFTLPGN